MISEDECIFSQVRRPIVLVSWLPRPRLRTGSDWLLHTMLPSLREAIKKSIGSIRLGKTVGGSDEFTLRLF